MITRTQCLIMLVCITQGVCVAKNRDRCTEIGQKCICSNTKLPGYCFPSFFSEKKELYCDCQSDVLTKEEMISRMAEKVANNEYTKTRVQQYYPEMIEVFSQILSLDKTLQKIIVQLSVAKIIHNSIQVSKYEQQIQELQTKRSPLITQVHEKMMRTQHPPLAYLFFNTSDRCTYYGQPCTCSNTGAEGICAVDRLYRQGDLYCHCGG